MSHPSWVCGLKQPRNSGLQLLNLVTPFVGVWIETCYTQDGRHHGWVTPFVGVWIETSRRDLQRQKTRSHPSWVCGLKLERSLGATKSSSHTLRGCVD